MGELSSYAQCALFGTARPPGATSLPPPADPPGPLSDCFWSVEAEAWLDPNANGLWDKEEQPLAGVRFRLDGDEKVSDSSGKAHFGVFPVWCQQQVEFEISALPPSGYEPTTLLPLRVRGLGPLGKCLFGFRRVH